LARESVAALAVGIGAGPLAVESAAALAFGLEQARDTIVTAAAIDIPVSPLTSLVRMS
jgi:hypothetical protein